MGAEPFEDSIQFKTRIETLSDLVFGLALSIGSIALIQHVPQQAAVSVLFLASVSNIFWISVPIAAYARFLMWYIALGIVLVSRVVVRPQKK